MAASYDTYAVLKDDLAYAVHPNRRATPQLQDRDRKRAGIFTHVLVDEFSPKLTRQGRGRPEVKGWVLVIVFDAVRAMHLELLVSKEACRRTVPRSITSDNVPEFWAADKLLREGSIDTPEGSSSISWSTLEWSTYPPYAAHFGGAVEVVVKLSKRALNN